MAMVLLPLVWLGAVLYQGYSAPNPRATTALWPHVDAITIVGITYLLFAALGLLSAVIGAMALCDRKWWWGGAFYMFSLAFLCLAGALTHIPAMDAPKETRLILFGELAFIGFIAWLASGVGLLSKQKTKTT
jgi:hypothetical protein